MKKASTLILISILLTSTQVIAQDFRVPAGQIKLKEDYTEYITYLDNKMPIYSKYLTNEELKTK